MTRPLEPVVFSNNQIFTMTSTLDGPFQTFLVLLISVVIMVSPHSSFARQLPPHYVKTAVQQSPTITSLEPAKPVDRELAVNEIDLFTISLDASSYVLIVADQLAVDVSLSIFDPNGKKLVETDMFRIGETESIFMVAESSGPYRLEVRRSDKNATKGHYELNIKELRRATEQDSSAVAAEKLVSQGMQLEQLQTADSRRKAIEKYQQSISFWHAAKYTIWQARTLCLIASNYISLSEKQKAFDLTNQALPIVETIVKQADGEQRRESIRVKAYALDTFGRAQQEFGDKKKAIELYDEAITLSRSIGDRTGEVNSLLNMGRAHQMMGDYPKALELAQRARLMVGELGDRRKEGTALNNICLAYQSTGEYAKGLDFCNQALSILRDTN